MNLNPAAVPLGLVVCYLGLVAYVLLKRRVRSGAERILLVYLIVSAIWNVFLAGSTVLSPDAALVSIGEQAALGGLAVLAATFLHLIHAFLQQPRRFAAAWWALSIASMLVLVLLNPEVLPLDLPGISIGGVSAGQEEILWLLSIFVWAGFTIAVISVIWRVYRETTSLMYRNRFRYLLLCLALLVLGDMLSATTTAPLRLFGSVLRLGSTQVLVLVVLRQRLVDIRSIYRRAFGYVAVTLLMTAVSLVSISVSAYLAGERWLYGALIGMGIASIVVSFVYPLVRNKIQRLVDRRLFNIQVDYETALRVYGERVIETLRLESLADLAVNTLIFTSGAKRGGLFLVREAKQEIGGLLLDPIKRVGELPGGDFELKPEDALALRLARSDDPLTQYEIDLHEDRMSLSTREKIWLREMAIEVLIPIHTRSKWVGLMVLGVKGSGEAYSSTELAWLKALAGQTAVALDNARLFGQIQDMSISVMRLNAELQRAYQQLQELDKLKSAFIGVISHELRSPLAAAGFSVQLLYRYAENRMFSELEDQIKQLDQELAEGRRMIDSVISFASLLSKQGELHQEETDVASLVRATVAPLEKMAEARNIALSCVLSPSLLPVRLDEARMAEAIHHLVHNAVKFNHQGGTVRVSCWPTKEHVVFKVEDTGKGIPPDRLGDIWEAFTQAADDVRRGVEGLGLGLALVKFVVEAHGGEAWAASKPQEGSTFGFRIPL